MRSRTSFRAGLADSTLLSHDLFEGTFARAGFASDVEVVDDFPSRYDVSARRHHRWARGDWQLLPWILGFAGKGGRAPSVKDELPRIGRWKMIDNLRRTLSAPACVLALAIGWTLSFESGARLDDVRARDHHFAKSHTRDLGNSGPSSGCCDVRALASARGRFPSRGDIVGVEYYVSGGSGLVDGRRHRADAVAAFRQSPTPARVDSRGTDCGGKASRSPGVRRPNVGSVCPRRDSVASGAPFRAWKLADCDAVRRRLWLISPAVARYVSFSPGIETIAKISEAQSLALRQTARRTWRFFETFVTADDNMLPPDNFQEDPTSEVAHRTSPTNIGLYLLSVVCARDFGWIGTAQTIERLEATLATMARMPRFRGHFYNWYDTRDLKALEPKYVSSVDSGNLAGHLIAIANACKEWRQSPMAAASRRAGIADALALTAEHAVHLRLGRRTQTVTPRQLEDSLAAHDQYARERLSVGGNARDSIVGTRRRGGNHGRHRQRDRTRAKRWKRIGSLVLGAGEPDRNRGASRGSQVFRLRRAHPVQARLLVLESAFRAMAMAMEFGFLFDPVRQLLSIGFLISESDPGSQLLRPSCIGGAAGEFLCDRQRRHSRPTLVPARSRRDAGYPRHGSDLLVGFNVRISHAAARHARARGEFAGADGSARRAPSDRIWRKLGLPWGISESAYNARDLELTYQYSNFGVPGLGLKRGLGENRVIAPYATGLATMIDPSAAAANFKRLATMGARGRYGYYEAVDFTPTRVPEGERFALVRAFMAHHQGMTIAAIANAVFDGAMRERFHAEPIIQATELLLQERVPREVASTRPWAAEVKSAARAIDADPSGGRKIVSVHQSTPATQLLSNGSYAVMMTAAGSGYSRWGDLAITRWREDATRDDSGSYIFLRDTRSGAVWSAGFQPTGAEPDEYAVDFNEDRVEIARRDGNLTTTLEVLVSAEDDAEVRRVSISNAGSRARDIEITSYSELALGPQGADVAHPAFAKMFVETEYLAEFGAILATRRKRSPSEPELWAAHLSVANGEAVGRPEFETDRARFLGRGQGVSAPIAMLDARPLTNSVGAVLDPIFALRRRVRVAAGATVRVAFWTMAAGTRAALLGLRRQTSRRGGI